MLRELGAPEEHGGAAHSEQLRLSEEGSVGIPVTGHAFRSGSIFGFSEYRDDDMGPPPFYLKEGGWDG